jgi:hypothetical protein
VLLLTRNSVDFPNLKISESSLHSHVRNWRLSLQEARDPNTYRLQYLKLTKPGERTDVNGVEYDLDKIGHFYASESMDGQYIAGVYWVYTY